MRPFLRLPLLLVTLVACTPDPRGDVAVSGSSTGDMAVHVRLCPGHDLKSIQLVDQGVSGTSDDDVPLWHMTRSAEGMSEPNDITVGAHLAGFETVIAYSGAVGVEAPLGLIVTTGDEMFILGFTSDQLNEGTVVSEERGIVSRAEFEEAARSDC